MTSLYVHVPFCMRKCAYCDFVSGEGTLHEKKLYTELLCREIALCAKEYKNRTIGTVFIGGGTPSCMPYGEIYRIMRQVYECFEVDRDAEISIECNPGTIDAGKLTEYIDCRINRISFGLQSTSDRLLSRIGRIHTYDDFLASLKLAKARGFKNINADIMYGLPGQTADDVKATLHEVSALGLTHVSAYSLILEEGTVLYASVKSGEVTLPSDDEEYAMHRTVVEYLQSQGYRRYEISNYSLPGYECRHNLVYWNVGEYIGVGLNSHSCIFENGEEIRRENYSDLASYDRAIIGGRLPVAGEERISHDEQMREFVMLGTRKTDGFALSEFLRRFGVEFIDVFGDALGRIDRRYYNIDENFSLTDMGLDMQNTVLCELI